MLQKPHNELVSYDLNSLRTIVEMWEGVDLSPVVAATDVVMVPVAPDSGRFA